ncbi:MAG TPA: hypothetical protein VF283_00755 [Bryobacteraceae bacterium]
MISGQLGPETAEVKAFFQSKGGSPNGGTLVTALHTWDSGAVEKMRDPFLLIPDAKRAPCPIEHDPRGVQFDADIGAWVTPWVMGVIDTRVVRRSSALLNRDFTYQEYMRFDGRNARLRATAFAAISGFPERAMKFQSVRHLMRRVGPRPGTGLSTKQWTPDGFVASCLLALETGEPAALSSPVKAILRTGSP